MVEEARLKELDPGLAPATDGWFVVNVGEAAWLTNDSFGARCVFEGDTPVLRGDQEDFVVLVGACVLLVEGEKRSLRAWDFVHCPPGTEHAFVGAGDGPCVIFMAGGRTREKRTVYPRSDLARGHGAGVDVETSSPGEAYARFAHWQLGRPGSWHELPWA